MKILLVCAGGASTSILMKKMTRYAQEQGIELEIKAKGVGQYEEHIAGCDVILLGPQVSYKLEEIQAAAGRPVAVIQPYDYAVGNADNIFRQIDGLQKG